MCAHTHEHTYKHYKIFTIWLSADVVHMNIHGHLQLKSNSRNIVTAKLAESMNCIWEPIGPVKVVFKQCDCKRMSQIPMVFINQLEIVALQVWASDTVKFGIKPVQPFLDIIYWENKSNSWGQLLKTTFLHNTQDQHNNCLREPKAAMAASSSSGHASLLCCSP